MLGRAVLTKIFGETNLFCKKVMNLMGCDSVHYFIFQVIAGQSFLKKNVHTFCKPYTSILVKVGIVSSWQDYMGLLAVAQALFL